MDRGAHVRFRGPADVARFVAELRGADEGMPPALLVFGVDTLGFVIGAALNAARTRHTTLSCSELALLREALAAVALVVVEVRAGRAAAPGDWEVRQFGRLSAACAHVGVTVHDAVVVDRHHWWSLRGLLRSAPSRAAANPDLSGQACTMSEWP